MLMQFAAPNSDRHQLIAFLGGGILAQLARYGSILFRNCIFGSLTPRRSACQLQQNDRNRTNHRQGTRRRLSNKSLMKLNHLFRYRPSSGASCNKNYLPNSGCQPLRVQVSVSCWTRLTARRPRVCRLRFARASITFRRTDVLWFAPPRARGLAV